MFISLNNKLTKHIVCPIICIMFTLSVLFIIKASKDYQKQVIVDDSIKGQINAYLNKCKEDYWVSQLVVENDTYIYKDVRGYNPHSESKNKVYSVKDKFLNKSKYNIRHPIDQNSLDLVKGFDTGLVGYYEIEDLKPYKAIYSALTEGLNVKMEKAIISITRNVLKRLIYVWVFTVSKEELQPCSREYIANTAKNISIFAKPKF